MGSKLVGDVSARIVTVGSLERERERERERADLPPRCIAEREVRELCLKGRERKKDYIKQNLNNLLCSL